MTIPQLKVTMDAMKAMKDFHALMRARGFKKLAITQSAMTEFRYSKTDPLHEPEITIGMHHGRGKWGPGKAILYMSQKRNEMYKLGFDCEKGNPNSTVDYATSEYSVAGALKHEKMIEDIRKFITNLS